MRKRRLIIKIIIIVVVTAITVVKCTHKHKFHFIENKELYEKSVAEIINHKKGFGHYHIGYINKEKFPNTEKIFKKVNITHIEKRNDCVIYSYDRDYFLKVISDVLLYNYTDSLKIKDLTIKKVYDDKWSEGKKVYFFD